MAYLLREVAANGSVTDHALDSMSNVQVTEGSTYSLIDSETMQPVEEASLRRRGDDLELQVDGELVADVEGFYTEGAMASFSDGESVVSSTADQGEAGNAWQAAEIGGVHAGYYALGLGAIALATGGGSGTAAAVQTILIAAAAGPFVTTMGVEIYGEDGTLLAELEHDFSTGPVPVDIDGDYTGVLLVKVIDINGDAGDYLDEATGEIVSLGNQSIRAMATTENTEVSVTPLTELATVLAGVTEDNTITEEQVATNDQVEELFGITDILGDVVTIVDEEFDSSDGTSDAEAYGQILAILSGADQVLAAEDETPETPITLTETIQQIADAITEASEGEEGLVLGEEAAALIVEGAEALVDGLEEQAAAAEEAGEEFDVVIDIEDAIPEEILEAAPDTTPPTTTISGIDISADTGTSAAGAPADSDFITNTAAQTITATLSAALEEGDVLMMSVDGGTTFTDVTSSVDGTAVSVAATLSAGSIQFRVDDAAGNQGAVATQAYTLDTSVPAISSAVVDASGATVTVTFSEDPSNELTLGAESFSIEVNGESYGFTAISLNGAVATLTLAQTIFADGTDTVGSLTTTAEDIAGNTLAAVAASNSSVAQAKIILEDYDALTGTGDLTIDQTGAAGNDLLSVKVFRESDTTDFSGRQINELEISQTGAAGNDTIKATLDAQFIGGDFDGTGPSSSFSTTVSSSNNISLEGGDGDDALSVNLHAQAAEVEYLTGTTLSQTGPSSFTTVPVSTTAAIAEVWSNNINLSGGNGADTLVVDIDATATDAMGTSASALSGHASATVADNDLYVLGGAGNDQAEINLAANAFGFDNNASVYANNSYNDISLFGGDPSTSADGADVLQVDITARAVVEATGLSDTDSVSTGPAEADLYGFADATNESNNIELYGNEGSDSLGVKLYANADVQVAGDALAIVSPSATNSSATGDALISAQADTASNNSNTIYLAGGSDAANDVLSVNLLGSVTAHAGGFALAAGGATATANGDYAYAPTSVSAEIYASAYFGGNESNYVTMVGQSGSDTLNLNLIANGEAVATGRAEAWGGHQVDAVVSAFAEYAYNSYGTYYLYGGSSQTTLTGDGADQISVNMIANQEARAQGTAIAMDNSYSADAYIDASVTSAYNYEMDLYVYGSAGADAIDVLLEANGYAEAGGLASANAVSSASAFISAEASDVYPMYSSYHYIYGGNNNGSSADGADIINYSAVGSAKAIASGTAIASASSSSGDASAYITAQASISHYYNDIDVYGSAGADQISLVFSGAANATAAGKATALATSSSGSADAYLYADASATFSTNDISVYGGDNSGSSNDGADSINLEVGLLANARVEGEANAVGTGSNEAYLTADAYAYLYYNEFYIYGSAGGDNIVVDLHATADAQVTGNAIATSGASIDATATAYVSSNDIYIYGGGSGASDDGADFIDLDLKASARAGINATGDGTTVTNLHDYAYAYVNYNSITVSGSSGVDTINADLVATANGGSGYGYAIVSSNELYFSGENVDLNLVANAFGQQSVSSSVQAYVDYNTITISANTSGSVAADIDVNLSALASAGSLNAFATATATVYSNDIDIYGGGQGDNIYLALDAMALAGGSSVEYNEITAWIDANDASILGGSGNDVITADLNAFASNESGVARAWIDNHGTTSQFALFGSAGNDSILFDADVMAVGLYGGSFTSSSLTAARFYNNAITLDGGSGSDNIDLNIAVNYVGQGSSKALSNGTTTYTINQSGSGIISSNNLEIYGGGGADSINLAFVADGEMFGNVIYIDGGTGSDVISFEAGSGHDTAGNVTGTLNAYTNSITFYYGSTGEFGDVINGLDVSVFSNNNVSFVLDGALFGAGYASGGAAGMTTTGAYLYYDTYGTATGTEQEYALYYDADGIGTGAAQAVAIFDTDVDFDTFGNTTYVF